MEAAKKAASELNMTVDELVMHTLREKLTEDGWLGRPPKHSGRLGSAIGKPRTRGTHLGSLTKADRRGRRARFIAKVLETQSEIDRTSGSRKDRQLKRMRAQVDIFVGPLGLTPRVREKAKIICKLGAKKGLKGRGRTSIRGYVAAAVYLAMLDSKRDWRPFRTVGDLLTLQDQRAAQKYLKEFEALHIIEMPTTTDFAEALVGVLRLASLRPSDDREKLRIASIQDLKRFGQVAQELSPQTRSAVGAILYLAAQRTGVSLQVAEIVRASHVPKASLMRALRKYRQP